MSPLAPLLLAALATVWLGAPAIAQLQPTATPLTPQPEEGPVTDVAGDWVFTVRWDSGGTIKPTVHIVRDENLDSITVEAAQREELKKDYPGFHAFAASAQWQRKKQQNSEAWIVLVRGGELQLRTHLFSCVGVLTVDSLPAAPVARAAKGTCVLAILGELGSFEAVRSAQPSRK